MQHIGIDIIEIARIQDAITRWGDNFLHRVFTGPELQSYRNHLPSLASRFAGKEAVIKALGTPRDLGFQWRDVEILSEPSGKPIVHLYGKAEKLAQSLGLSNVAISLSHSREHAIALAIGEQGDT